jgi:hypothetical protein
MKDAFVSEHFLESNRVPIDGDYDVLVIGGGVAGVSAALAARRSGCSTLIIEKSVMLGGLATLGLIAYYLPLCDGRGRKVIGGIAEELLHLSIKYGYDTLPEEWKRGGEGAGGGARYRTAFSSPAFAVALDEIVEQEGIEVLFDAVFSRPVLEDGLCKGVVVENKSGRIGYRGKVIVDATGDADVMARAGAECVEGANWLSYWAYFTDLDKMQQAVESGEVLRGIDLQALGVDLGKGNLPGESEKYRGIDARDVTRIVLDGRRLLRQELRDGRNRERSVLAIPGMAQLRTTRRIRGYYELTEANVFTRFDDSIGCTGDWRTAGPVYEIPYRTLLSRGIRNIITAGRSIASAGDAWEVTRVIPAASLTGQAAGTAAALAVAEGCDLSQIPVRKLQRQLADAGVLIHAGESELGVT